MEHLRNNSGENQALEKSKSLIDHAFSLKLEGATKNDTFSYMRLLFDEYKFDKAYFLLQELKKADPSFFHHKPPVDNELIRDLEQLHKETLFLTGEMEIETDWIIEKVKAGSEHIMLKYKKLPGESIYALKYEAELEVSIFNLCAMIYEVDIFPKWIPFCSKAKTVKKISKAFKIAFFQIDPPFLYSREAYIKGIGVDRLEENGSILILSGSVDVDATFQKKYNVDIPKNPNTVRLNLTSCGMELKPITRNKFKVRVISSCDPRIPYIPEFVLNFCMRKGGSYLFDKMITHAKNIEGTEWENRIKGVEDRDFYTWLETKLDNYFKLRNC